MIILALCKFLVCTGPYHFYFQFLEPFLSTTPFDTEQVVEAVRRNLRAFVGVTAFEDLCR